MKLLLIDTCGMAGSVALADGERVVAEAVLGVRSASEELMPVVRRMLGEMGWGVDGLEAVGVVRGPGSFTGVRTGWSVGKGLCEARGISLVGVSRLGVMAARKGVVHAVLDAGRGQFYYGRYRDGGMEREALVDGGEMREMMGEGGRWVGCEERVLEELGALGMERVKEPTAGDALRLVMAGMRAGANDVLEDALYLRRTDAEIFAKAPVQGAGG